MSDYYDTVKFAVLRDPKTMEPSIVEFDRKYIGMEYVDGMEVLGFARGKRGAYSVIDYYLEMER